MKSKGIVISILIFVMLTGCGSGSGGTTSVPPTNTITESTINGGGSVSTGTTVLSTAAGYAVDVDMNSVGTAVAVWQGTDSVGRMVSSRFQSGIWDTPVILSPANSRSGRVSVNANGDAIVVWSQVISGVGYAEETVWACLYRNGAWSSPERISANSVTDYSFYAFMPTVGLDDSGNAIAAWLQDDPDTTARSAWYSRYDGNAWSTPTRLSDGVHGAHEIEMAMNSAGDATVVWRQDTYSYQEYMTLGGSGVPNMWAANYVGGSWNTPVNIGDQTLANYDFTEGVRVSMNTDGKAIVVYQQRKDAVKSIVANIFTLGQPEPWLPTPLTVVSTSTSDVAWPSVDISDTGDIFVGWAQTTSIGWSEVAAWARHYSAASATWADPMQISISTSYINGPVVRTDSVGNGYAAWYETGIVWGTSGWKFNRFYPATGWSTKQDLPGGNIQSADMVAAGNGYATLVIPSPSSVVAFTWP